MVNSCACMSPLQLRKAVAGIIHAESFSAPCELNIATDVIKSKCWPLFESVYRGRAEVEWTRFFSAGSPRDTLKWVKMEIYKSIPDAAIVGGRMVKCFEHIPTADSDSDVDSNAACANGSSSSPSSPSSRCSASTRIPGSTPRRSTHLKRISDTASHVVRDVRRRLSVSHPVSHNQVVRRRFGSEDHS